MRILLPFILFIPLAALACKPPPEARPPAVEELLKGSAYVAYVEVISVKSSGETDVAEVKVLEHFKGERLSSVISSSDSCGLLMSPGERRILFLSGERKGHALVHPWNLSPDAILAKLRSAKR
jgi:hypothetical protein